MRPFRCADCGGEDTVDTVTGPLPSKCRACDPETWAKRAAKRARSLAGVARRRARMAAAEARVVELEALLVEQRGTLPPHLGEPGKAAVGRAVRRLALAEGHRETAQRARELAMVADAWAAVLDVAPAKGVDFLPARLAA